MADRWSNLPLENQASQLLTIPQVAAHLQTSTAYVHDLIRLKQLDSIDIGLPGAKRKTRRVLVSEFQTFLRCRTIEPSGKGRRYTPLKHGRVAKLYDPLRVSNMVGRRFTPQEVAVFLNIKPEHVCQIIRYGHLKAVDVSCQLMKSRFRICDRDLVEFIIRSTERPKRDWHRSLVVPVDLRDLESQMREAMAKEELERGAARIPRFLPNGKLNPERSRPRYNPRPDIERTD